MTGTSLVVQWLRLCGSTAGGIGLIPGWGSQMPHCAALPHLRQKKRGGGEERNESRGENKRVRTD